jgi:hypothetical protein
MNVRAAFATALLSIALVASAADQTREFRRFYNVKQKELVKAFNTKNAEFFRKVSVKDFVYIDHAGNRTNLDTSLQSMKQMFSMMKTLDVSMKTKSLKARNNVATVMVSNTVKGTLVGPDNKTHVMTLTHDSADTWKRIRGKWMLAQVKEVTKPVYKMDGKPFDPNQAGG